MGGFAPKLVVKEVAREKGGKERRKGLIEVNGDVLYPRLQSQFGSCP